MQFFFSIFFKLIADVIVSPCEMVTLCSWCGNVRSIFKQITAPCLAYNVKIIHVSGMCTTLRL